MGTMVLHKYKYLFKENILLCDVKEKGSVFNFLQLKPLGYHKQRTFLSYLSQCSLSLHSLCVQSNRLHNLPAFLSSLWCDNAVKAFYFYFLNYILLIVLLQLSWTLCYYSCPELSPFFSAPTGNCDSLRQSCHHGSCPWVMRIRSLATPFSYTGFHIPMAIL